MSIKTFKEGFTVHGYTLKKFSHLEGRIRTIIETLGLPEKQEKSLTDLIVGETWGLWDKAQYTYQYEGSEQSCDAKLIK